MNSIENELISHATHLFYFLLLHANTSKTCIWYVRVLDSDCLVCMAAICYSGPISAIPTNEQLLSEKRTGTKFQIDSLKTGRLVCLYRQRDISISTQLIMLIIYIYIS